MDTTNKLAEEQEREKARESFCRLISGGLRAPQREKDFITGWFAKRDATPSADQPPASVCGWPDCSCATAHCADAPKGSKDSADQATQPAEAVAIDVEAERIKFVAAAQAQGLSAGDFKLGAFLGWLLAKQDAAHPAPASASEPLCACKDRPASQCDEEWGPNCDLGNNAAHARQAPEGSAAAVDAALGIKRASASVAGAGEGLHLDIVEQGFTALLDSLMPNFEYVGVSLRVSSEDHAAIRSAMAGARTAIQLLKNARESLSRHPQPQAVTEDARDGERIIRAEPWLKTDEVRDRLERGE